MLRIWIWDPVPFLPRIRNRYFAGSRIPDPNPYFRELNDNFGAQSSIILCELASILFLHQLKIKISLNSVIFVALAPGTGGAVCTGTGGAVCTGTGGAVCYRHWWRSVHRHRWSSVYRHWWRSVYRHWWRSVYRALVAQCVKGLLPR